MECLAYKVRNVTHMCASAQTVTTSSVHYQLSLIAIDLLPGFPELRAEGSRLDSFADSQLLVHVRLTTLA